MAFDPGKVARYTAKLLLPIYAYSMTRWDKMIAAIADELDSQVGAIKDEVTAARGGFSSISDRVDNQSAGIDANTASIAAFAGVVYSGGTTYKGSWDASTGAYPVAPAKGDHYDVNVAGEIENIYYREFSQFIYSGTQWLPRQSVLPVGGIAKSSLVAMTAATDGSNGIRIEDSPSLGIGDGDFSIHWVGSYPDYSPSGGLIIAHKYEDPGNYWSLILTSGGTLRIVSSVAASIVLDKTSTAAMTAPASEVCAISCTVSREAAGVAGEVRFYVNAAQLGASIAITAGAPASAENAGSLFVNGSSTTRSDSVLQDFSVLNRVLSPVEVSDTLTNGPSLVDMGANQTELTSGAITEGKRYRIASFLAGDDFTNVGAGSNATGVEFIATGTTPTTWSNSSVVKQIGVTLWINSEECQGNTAQIFDRSGNGNHAKLPASGAARIPESKQFEVRSRNTWAASSATQYLTGINEELLSVKSIITEVLVEVSGTAIDGTLGDGSDADRYVTALQNLGLIVGLNFLALNKRGTDGSNLKLAWTPIALFTGNITFTVRGYERE